MVAAWGSNGRARPDRRLTQGSAVRGALDAICRRQTLRHEIDELMFGPNRRCIVTAAPDTIDRFPQFPGPEKFPASIPTQTVSQHPAACGETRPETPD